MPLATRDLPSDVRPLVEAVNQQISRNEAMAAQRRGFIDDASHQLRTPLSILRAQMDYVLREPEPDQRRLAVQAVSDALDHAIRATNQLLTLARTDTAQPQREAFDLGDLTREVALALLPLARARGIDFGVELSAEHLPAEGDRELLQHALSNIAHNAIQHGRAKGVVTLVAASDALGYSLQVSDDGPGIDATLAQRLGQRFVKNRNSQGSGLGMAIALSVIERHSGRLRIESAAPGVGVCVSLWWPKS
jgi:two-component system sensor histidine kinase TctE